MPDAPAPSSAPDMSGLAAAAAATVAQMNGQTPAPAPQAPVAPAAPQAPTPPAAPAAQPGPFDSLPSLEETPEAPAASEATPENPDGHGPDANAKPEQVSRWKELRKVETEYKQIKPDYEAKTKRVVELEQKLAQLETTPTIPEEVTRELEELRLHRAAYDVKLTPEYKDTVVAPMHKQFTFLQEVSDYAGVDHNKLLEATDEPNRLKRNAAIAAVLAEATNQVDQNALSEVYASATQLHEVYQKGRALEDKAVEIKAGLTSKQQQETAAQQQAREAEFVKERSDVFNQLSAKFKPLITPEIEQTLASVKAAESPREKAMHAQAWVLLPQITQKFLEMRNKVATMEKAEKARIAARPGIGQQSPVAPAEDGNRLSLDDAIRSQFPQSR